MIDLQGITGHEMDGLEQLKERVAALEARNRRVERDKAWETSKTRRAAIILLTYALLSVYMGLIGVNNPWVNAAIPTAGFWLSTLTLPIVKQFWGKHKYKD